MLSLLENESLDIVSRKLGENRKTEQSMETKNEVFLVYTSTVHFHFNRTG